MTAASAKPGHRTPSWSDPDGHVVWVGEGSTAGLSDALDRWFS